MNYEHLIIQIGNDSVAEITLNRPAQLNTYNTHLAIELAQVLNELE